MNTHAEKSNHPFSAICYFCIGQVLQPPPPGSKNAALLVLGAVSVMLNVAFFMAGLMGVLFMFRPFSNEPKLPN